MERYKQISENSLYNIEMKYNLFNKLYFEKYYEIVNMHILT